VPPFLLSLFFGCEPPGTFFDPYSYLKKLNSLFPVSSLDFPPFPHLSSRKGCWCPRHSSIVLPGLPSLFQFDTGLLLFALLYLKPSERKFDAFLASKEASQWFSAWLFLWAKRVCRPSREIRYGGTPFPIWRLLTKVSFYPLPLTCIPWRSFFCRSVMSG